VTSSGRRGDAGKSGEPGSTLSGDYDGGYRKCICRRRGTDVDVELQTQPMPFYHQLVRKAGPLRAGRPTDSRGQGHLIPYRSVVQHGARKYGSRKVGVAGCNRLHRRMLPPTGSDGCDSPVDRRTRPCTDRQRA